MGILAALDRRTAKQLKLHHQSCGLSRGAWLVGENMLSGLPGHTVVLNSHGKKIFTGIHKFTRCDIISPFTCFFTPKSPARRSPLGSNSGCFRWNYVSISPQ